MTLIVAIPAQDGVIFGSDSQVTTGSVRSTATKIFRLNEYALWGASGELALIQCVAEQIENYPRKKQPLMAIRDELGLIVKNVVDVLLRTDFRTQFMMQDPNLLLQLHPADFLFVEHRDKPRILHVMAHGTSEWIEGGFKAIGNGDLFVHALLQKYTEEALTCDHAKLLAYKVIEETIQVVAYGLGPPIDIWEVCSNGVKQATEGELIAIGDAAHLLRNREVKMLTSSTPHRVPATESDSSPPIPTN